MDRLKLEGMTVGLLEGCIFGFRQLRTRLVRCVDNGQLMTDVLGISYHCHLGW